MTDTTTATSTPSNDAGQPTTNASNATPAESTAVENKQTGTQETKTTEPVVPESYDLKMPEGVELDKAAADEFTAIAKELKLDQVTAQKLADVAAKQAQRQVEAHAQQVASWVEQVKTDKEIGGDKLDENLGVARKAIDTFGSPELKELLSSTGMGNHPEVIKLAYKVGKAISEDGFVKGTPPGPETDPAKKLYPNMN